MGNATSLRDTGRMDRPGGADAAAVAPFAATPLAHTLRRVLTAAAQTHPAMARRLELSATETWAIEHLMAEPMGPVELSRRLGVTSAAATLLIRRLEDTGHVVREAHPSDQRRIVLRPTPASERSVLTELLPLLDELEQAAAHLGEDQRAATTDYLDRVADVLDRFCTGA